VSDALLASWPLRGATWQEIRAIVAAPAHAFPGLVFDVPVGHSALLRQFNGDIPADVATRGSCQIDYYEER
jgi:hypothetical protein